MSATEPASGRAEATGTALVTGATGFVGGRLADALAQRGWSVRCMVRDPDGQRARDLAARGFEVRRGDVLRPETLAGAGRGADVAYYLIHSMGRGSEGEDFAASEAAAARAFAEMARREGVGKVVYLGGLGDRPQSRHLRSRHATALALAEHGPPLTYFRAGMVVGARSESYRTLRHLVERLPVMIVPARRADRVRGGAAAGDRGGRGAAPGALSRPSHNAAGSTASQWYSLLMSEPPSIPRPLLDRRRDDLRAVRARLRLLGKSAWWLPGPLDRVLPDVRFGHG